MVGFDLFDIGGSFVLVNVFPPWPPPEGAVPVGCWVFCFFAGGGRLLVILEVRREDPSSKGNLGSKEVGERRGGERRVNVSGKDRVR